MSREPLFEHYSPELEGENTPSPPLVEIGGLLAGSDAESSSSSSSSSSSDSDSNSDSDSIKGGAASSSGLSGSGDDYIDEEVIAASKAARVKAMKEGKKVRELKGKVPKPRSERITKKKEGTGTGNGKGKGKGKRKAEGEGDTVFDMIADSVSKAASGGDLGVDDTRFEELMKDIDDDEDDFLGGGEKVSKRTREHRPTPEVARLLGEANASYAINGASEALEIYLQVVRHDQYIPQAWSSLASCCEELGKGEAARQMRFFAAHVDRDGEKWASLAAEFKDLGQMNQCLYCLTQALRIDPSDVDALWEVANIHRAQGSDYKAVKAFQRMLKHDPESANNFQLLQDFHPLIISTKQFAFGSSAYRTAFDYHLETYPHPPRDDDDEEEEEDEGNTMELEHVVSLVDILNITEKLEEAVEIVRRGQRWLQGRGEQKYWDTFEDDREYTVDGEEGGNELDIGLRHRLALLRLRLGNDEEAFGHIEQILQLDVVTHQDMFVELGQALMKRELWEKALDCFASINEEDAIEDEPSNIFALGVCLHQTGKADQAVEYLRWVAAEDPDHLEARLRLANVLEEKGEKAEALEIVTDVLRRRAQQGPTPRTQPRVSKADKNAHQSLTKRVLEDQMRQKMVALWQEVISAERELEEGDVGALDNFIHSAGTMIDNHRMAKHMFTRHRGVSRVSKTKLRSHGQLVDVDVLAIQDRLERSLGLEENIENEAGTVLVRMTDFYGLSREDWLSLVIKYCCVLMAKHENEVALEILEHMLYSAIFYSRRCEIALRLTIIACAHRSKLYNKVMYQCRKLSQAHQFRPEPLYLLQAALTGGGQAAHTEWCSLNLQRFIHREMSIFEEAIEAKGMHFSHRIQRWAIPPQTGISRLLGDQVDERRVDDDDDAGAGASGVQKKKKGRKSKGVPGTLGEAMEEDEDEDDELEEEEEEELSGGIKETKRPTRVSPAWSALYGQYMLSSASHHGALYYLLRAYELNPYDAYICFMITQAFFGRSMNRQSDNRNYQIAQGLAFLTKYRKLASKDAESQEEVEYNYGRSFHGIGVPHLAVVHYEKVLTMVQKRMDAEEHEDVKEDIRRTSLACSAAHNLILLYTATGSMDLVKAKSRWLAI